MSCRQAPAGPNPVFKIQGPDNTTDINTMRTSRITFRFMTEQATAGFFLNSNYLLFHDVPLKLSLTTIFLPLPQLVLNIFYFVKIIANGILTVTVFPNRTPLAYQVQAPRHINVGNHAQQQPPAAFIQIVAAPDA